MGEYGCRTGPPPGYTTQPGGIGSLESILGLLKKKQIWAQNAPFKTRVWETAAIQQRHLQPTSLIGIYFVKNVINFWCKHIKDEIERMK